MRHIEIECLGAVVMVGPNCDCEAHLAQRNGGSIGETGERPCRGQPFVGDLQLLERLHRDHVEARTPSRSVFVMAILLMVWLQTRGMVPTVPADLGWSLPSKEILHSDHLRGWVATIFGMTS